MNGTIRRLTLDRGFGFLRGDDGRDYFFHRSDLADGADGFSDLNEDDKVTFEPVVPAPEKGLRAAKVRLVEAATAVWRGGGQR